MMKLYQIEWIYFFSKYKKETEEKLKTFLINIFC